MSDNLITFNNDAVTNYGHDSSDAFCCCNIKRPEQA